jgi:hypothetical protein
VSDSRPSNAIIAQLAALVSELQRNPVDADQALTELIESAPQFVPGAQYAAITLASQSSGISTPAATHRYPAVLDKIQRRPVARPPAHTHLCRSAKCIAAQRFSRTAQRAQRAFLFVDKDIHRPEALRSDCRQINVRRVDHRNRQHLLPPRSRPQRPPRTLNETFYAAKRVVTADQ